MAQLRRQVFNKLEGDATLIAKLGDGVNSIMPAVRSTVIYEPKDSSETPFLFVKMEDDTPIDAPIIGRLEIAIYVYDDPGQGYWAIDRIVHRLKELLEAEAQQFTVDSGEEVLDVRTDWEGTSGELFDDGYQKSYRLVRFGLYH